VVAPQETNGIKESPRNVFDHIWFYDPDTGFGELQNFALQGPNAMEVGQWERTNERPLCQR
jgi:hypothetical protein